MSKCVPRIRCAGQGKRETGHCRKKHGSIPLKIIRRICDNYLDNFRHEQLGGGAIADAILDRIVPGSNIMEIQGDVSMRQRLAEESV